MKTLFLVGALLFPGALFAQRSDTNSFRSLVSGCQKVERFQDPQNIAKAEFVDFIEAGGCLGYIEALHDASTFIPGFCIPRGVVTGDLVKIILKYAADHPEMLHESKATGAIVAIAAAFPCKPESK
jgi:hypothetical protein